MAEPASRRVVIVAGMHRAGTSVVARALQALGLDLGDALMAADARQNARGFYEDVDVVRIDDALLAAHGADWKSVSPLQDVDWDGAAHGEARTAMRRLLEARLARTGAFAFKDPRVPRVLPLWQRVLRDMRAEDAYVVAVRHPFAVVDSLTARDRLDARRSAWLWLVHTLCSLAYTHGRPRVVVDYDRVLAAPLPELGRIARALGLPPPSPAQPEVRAFTEDFLSAELRHAAYAPSHLPAAGMPRGVVEAHALVQRLAADELDPASPDAIAQIDAQFAALAAESPLLDYAGSLERAADEVPRLTGELDWARGSLAEAKRYNEGLHKSLTESQAFAQDLSGHLARKERELVAAHGTLDRVRERALGRMILRGIARQDVAE